MKHAVVLLARFYDQRAGAENLIKEAKNDAGLAAYPSGRWLMNCNHIQLVMLAYVDDLLWGIGGILHRSPPDVRKLRRSIVGDFSFGCRGFRIDHDGRRYLRHENGVLRILRAPEPKPALEPWGWSSEYARNLPVARQLRMSKARPDYSR